MKYLAQKAKEASKSLRIARTEEKNTALLLFAEELENSTKEILSVNQQEVEKAAKTGLSLGFCDRLSLKGRLEGIVEDLRKVAKLPDPVGEILEEIHLPSGLKLQKKRVPIGVLGVIYESRPNVTVDVASLALKTGNAAILRGGKETLATNRLLITLLKKALERSPLPVEAIQFIDRPDRSLVLELLKLDREIDMIIPRGGASLHRFCVENSTIPVITGGVGICHLFVDESADLEKSLPVIVNAKTDRPSVCNALDTLLLHKEIAENFLPRVISTLTPLGVSFRLDTRSWDLLSPQEGEIFKKAAPSDWATEWLSLTLGIRIVDSLEEAITHIETHSSGHSESILTNNREHANLFVERVDAAAVYINASTRFTDGGAFGMGAEIAVSTQKLHVRGPMGLKELTTYKWIGEGDYLIR
ncbi:MAG: Gamma-glutamyl phosphate reductase [Chlamydiae bacterium]|nr:Gamma-glutamyl phosphate reductase [Chlamydiota bacterium]